MRRIAVIGAVLENPHETQEEFNRVVSDNMDIVKGRNGTPFEKEGIGVVSLTVMADMDRINDFTGKLGALPNISVKTAVSKKEVE